MQTIKLHEATKQFGISNKLAMFFLEKKNIPVKSHSSVITIDQLESLRDFSSKQDKFSDLIKEFNHAESEREKKQKEVKDKSMKSESEAVPMETHAVIHETPPPPATTEKKVEEPTHTPIKHTKPEIEKTTTAEHETKLKEPKEPKVEEKPVREPEVKPRESQEVPMIRVYDEKTKEHYEIRPRSQDGRPMTDLKSRDQQSYAQRPPENRPPRDSRPQQDNRPRDNRPPRDSQGYQRPDNRPPRDPNRPPQDNRDNRPPRDPQGYQRPDNRPPRDPNRPTDNRPPRDNRPRDGRPDDGRPRGPQTPGQRPPDSRFKRDGNRPYPPRREPGSMGDDKKMILPIPDMPAENIYGERKKRVEKVDVLKDTDILEKESKKESLLRPGKKDKPKLKQKGKKDFLELDETLIPGIIVEDPLPAVIIPEEPIRKEVHGRGSKNKSFDSRRNEPPKEIQKPKPKEKVYNLPELIQTSDFITLKDLADKLNLKLRDIEERMKTVGKEYNSNAMLDTEAIKEICAEFKVGVEVISYEDEIFYNQITKMKAEPTHRPPVVTIMGHVDHGKTTLLDTLRKTRVAEKEAGGITQKIGAYKLTYKGNDIVFIDTPGHEAFTNIRARGAKVTDIVVLVVAANDGVQPQTIEAINHARAGKVPMVVAINKIDMDGADSSKVKQQLARYDVVVEDWGGEVVAVEISAKHNKNLDALLEMINLSAEMLELKAYKEIPARGVIIESRLDPQLGPIGTVLLQNGKVKKGDFFICGNSVGKVKSIFDDHSKVLNDAEVPMPIEIMGFEEIPEAGELFQVTDDSEKAKKVVDLRKQRGKEARNEGASADKIISLENLFEKMSEDKSRVFPLIIRTDNFSSCEVLEKILMKQIHESLKINIIQKGVGNITESDILLAATSGAVIIGFNVKAPQKLMALAKRDKVEIRLYNVIYHLIEEFEKAIRGEIAPEYVERLIGKAEVLQIFKISKLGIIAGCIVKDGKVTNKSKIKVVRKHDLVFEGEIETLRRVKNEASEVNAGTECGIRVKNFNAIEVGDTLEIYEVKVKPIV